MTKIRFSIQCSRLRVGKLYNNILERIPLTTSWTEICQIFAPHPALRGQFLLPESGQKQTFFDPLPSSCPRNY